MFWELLARSVRLGDGGGSFRLGTFGSFRWELLAGSFRFNAFGMFWALLAGSFRLGAFGWELLAAPIVNVVRVTFQ